MSYYLGIDGGGTKTMCAVGDESRTLATATAGPSNIVRVGEAMARESLQQAIRQACAAASVEPSKISRTCVGAAGAARPEVAEIVRRCVGQLISTPVDVVGDMHIALEAVFDSGPGVVVNSGTGSFAFGRDQQGRTARAGGWGFAIGDEGSAHWIGRAAVVALLRASDANDEVASSPLAIGLFKAWGVRSLSDLARAGNSISPPDFSALFPAVVASKDDLAMQVLTSAGRELAVVASVIIGRLFPKGDSSVVPVAMIGSVFRHAELVRQVFYDELRHFDGRAAIESKIVEPVEGALRMARRAVRSENENAGRIPTR